MSLAAELTHREAELQRLFELVQNAEHGVSPEDVLDRIFDGFSDLIPYDRIGCAFLSDDGERLKAHWARSNLGPPRLVVGFSRPMAGSSLQQILETRQPRILNDLEAYLEAKPFSLSTRLVVEEGGRSSLTCPLIANGRPIGFLFFTSREVNAYRDIHQAIFNQIANQISIVIEKSRIFQQIAYTARHDALTGLPNRALFFETLTRALGRVGEDGSLAVLYLDLDHFKRVNDTLGHPVGDALLKKMSRRLRRCVGARGAVARLGGDEFAVIQGPIASAAEVATLADEIGEAVRAPLTIDGYDVDVDVSIGAAIAPEHGDEVDELLKKADVALYDVKKAGRGAFRLFRPEMTARAIERMEVERDLRRALANTEFELHYQPIISLADDRIVAVEALARWRHPQRGLVLPAEFIPIAEEVGLIDALGEWALRTACAEAAGWPSDARVAVNVSARQFAGRGLVATVIDAVRSAGLAAATARARSHRVGVPRKFRGQSRHHARADRLRRHAGARRFRRRLLVARLPADLLLQPHQDRPRFRRRPAGAARILGDRPRDLAARPEPAHRRHRRGRRDDAPDARSAVARLHRDAGLPVRPALPGGRTAPPVAAGAATFAGDARRRRLTRALRPPQLTPSLRCRLVDEVVYWNSSFLSG